MKKFFVNVVNGFQKIYKVLSDNFIYFSQRTALHGVKYIGKRELSFFDRLFFSVSFILILGFASILTSNIYAKWVRTPVIVSYNAHPTRVFDVPFPSVTICNANQVRASKVQNLTKNSFEYYILKTLCSRSIDEADVTSELYDVRNRSMYQRFLSARAQPCEQLFILCRFGTRLKNCLDIFTTVLTDEGICCVFNAMHLSYIFKKPGQVNSMTQGDGTIGVDWDPEDGYQKKLPKNFYPRLGPGTGVSLGLTVIINAEVDDYYCSSTNGVGFKVLLHNPMEIPTLRENGLIVEAGSEISFRIEIDRSESTHNIRNFNIRDRQCVFKSERKLGFFKTYTRSNCELECLSNITEQVCGCTSFFLPETWTNAPACGLKDMECQEPILNWSPAAGARKSQQACKQFCMQDCFDLTYYSDRTTIPLSSGNYMISEEILEEFNSTYRAKNIAVIHFYYQHSHFTGSIRARYIGMTEFMSYTGGFIGLLGFSFISVAEIVYFLILKSLGTLASWMERLVVGRVKDLMASRRKVIQSPVSEARSGKSVGSASSAMIRKRPTIRSRVSYRT